MQKERASKKQQELFTYVKEFIAEHDYGPSYREIMRALGYKSVSTVAIHIDGLIAKGYLTRRDNSARSLEVVTSSPSSASASSAPNSSIEIITNEILKRVTSADLSTEQKAQVAQVCTLLGLTEVAEQLQTEETS